MSADEYARRDPAWSRLTAPLAGSVRAIAVEAVALAFVLAGGGVLFARGLDTAPSFDEGVYLAQTDALLHGQRLGTDVFAAQPPGFHWLLLAFAKIGGIAIHPLRVAILVLALVGVAAAYLVGRELAGPLGGLAAAAVLVVAPPYPSFAASVMADLPGTALALLALACLLAARRRPWLALVGGALFAAAEWVKLDAFILLLPALAYLAARRLNWRIAGAAASVAAVLTAVGLAVLGSALPAVWRGAVSYHVAARDTTSESNTHALRSFFEARQPFTWLVVAGLLAWVFFRPRRALPLGPLWTTAVAAALFLLWHKPLHDNHLVLLSVALAVPVGASLAHAIERAPVIAIVLAAGVAAGYVQETRRLDRNAAPLPAALAWAASQVAADSTAAQLVVSDEPIVPVLAHRRMPGLVIDTAVLRFDTGYLTDADVLHAIDANRVPVVVAGRAFLQEPRLLIAIAKRFPPPRVRDGIRVYAR